MCLLQTVFHFNGTVSVKFKYIILGAIFSQSIFAQDFPQNQPIFFEKNLEEPKLSPVQIEQSTAPINIVQNTSIDDRINQAIIGKDWLNLESYLAQYHQAKEYDHILYSYGLGALYRHQGKLKEAIQQYQQITKDNPSLYYPKFDLAMMLFEDKRYFEAKKQFESVRPFLTVQLQGLVDQVLREINKSQGWQPNLNLSYRKTDNVNQSSNIREITLNGAKFIRNQDSLPQKAQGIDYALSIFREKNIIKNSYLNFSISLDGISYWDNKDYSEQTWNSSIGYAYKDVHQSWGVTPFVQQNMLGDSRYSFNYGTTLDYSRQLSNRLKFVVSSTYLQKNYQDTNIANHYNGNSNSQTALLIYQLKSNILLYSGIDHTQDRLSDKSESSIKTGIRTGFLYLSSPINIRTNIRYAKRNFEANNVWYKDHRKDNEYELGVSIWHQQWQWKGFTPKLNYKYQKIDSNLPLYKRSNNSWFITVDKTF